MPHLEAFTVTFCAFCAGFILFIALLYIVISLRFHCTFHVFCRIMSLTSYNVMVGFAFLSLYVILLTVSCYW